MSEVTQPTGANPATQPRWRGARGQALVLLAFSAICAILAATIKPGDETGLLAIGFGFLMASFVNRGRFFIAGAIAAPFALGNVLWLVGAIRLSQLEAVHLLGLGVALAAVALAARRGILDANPLSAAALVALVGALLLGLTTPSLASSALLSPVYRLLMTFWAPAIIFAAAGIAELALSFRVGARASHRA